MKTIDYRVYVVTDEGWGRTHAEVAEAALKGGATVIQLRDKARSDDDLIPIAREIRRLTKEAGVTFIVNDRIGVAIEAEADGIHVGQSDAAIETIREITDALFIGVSAGNVDEAIDAERRGADYIGAGPVFPTGTKEDAGDPCGLSGLEDIVQNVRVPVVAIGGVQLAHTRDVIGCGTAGTAVISAIVGADDMTAATAAFREEWEQYGNHR